MMKCLMAAISFAASVTALAQVSANVVAGPSGRSQIVINNPMSSPVEAFEVTWVEPRGSHFSNNELTIKYADDRLGAPYRPARKAAIPIRGGLDTPVQLRAAILQDGSTYGDPEWVAVLQKRREQYNATADAFLKELLAAANEPLSQDDWLQRMEALREAQLAAIPPSPGNGAIGLPALIAAAQREGVEAVSDPVVASFKTLPKTRKKPLLGPPTESTLSLRVTVALTIDQLKRWRS